MTLKGRACIVQARPFLFRSYQSPLYFACTVPTSLSRLPADSVRCCEGDTVIFRQLFEPLSSTYTYLLGCEETRQAVLIDPVLMAVERDLAEISRLDLTHAYTLDSHIHADHVTAALELKDVRAARSRRPRMTACPVSMSALKKEHRSTWAAYDCGHATHRATPTATTPMRWPTASSPAMRCSSRAAAAPIFKTATPIPCIAAYAKSSSPSQRSAWSTQRMIITAGASPPSRRKRRATHASAATAHSTTFAGSWPSWICPTPNSWTTPCPATDSAASARVTCRPSSNAIAGR